MCMIKEAHFTIWCLMVYDIFENAVGCSAVLYVISQYGEKSVGYFAILYNNVIKTARYFTIL